jgi:DNA-directed RNA polymerase specialized sigma24 family protein
LLPHRTLAELEALYRARRAHFVRVARATTADPERAAEAVQDAFAAAVRSRDEVRGDGALEAWVWRAVVNAARKTLRPRCGRRRAPTTSSRRRRRRMSSRRLSRSWEQFTRRYHAWRQRRR